MIVRNIKSMKEVKLFMTANPLVNDVLVLVYDKGYSIGNCEKDICSEDVVLMNIDYLFTIEYDDMGCLYENVAKNSLMSLEAGETSYIFNNIKSFVIINQDDEYMRKIYVGSKENDFNYKGTGC